MIPIFDYSEWPNYEVVPERTVEGVPFPTNQYPLIITYGDSLFYVYHNMGDGRGSEIWSLNLPPGEFPPSLVSSGFALSGNIGAPTTVSCASDNGMALIFNSLIDIDPR